MSNLGTAYVQIAPSAQGLSGALNKVFAGQGNNVGKALGSRTGGGFMKSGVSKVIAGTFAAAVATGIGTIAASLSSAVQRYDTIQNFPKVMENFGIAGDKSAAAMKRLDKGLQGLPTSMDAAASGVQNITGATGDVDKATDIFLALNNAILAGGQPMDAQASAMEQFTQAFSKGKPDMMEWRALQSAMPAQLKQVATAMGYVGQDGVAKLGEDLRNGKVPLTDFTDALVGMNEKGVDGFPSLAEQAKNATGGIGTSMSNMKTAVVRGVANMIGSINEAAGKNGFPTIGESLAIVTDKINSGFKAAQSVVTAFFNFMGEHGTTVKVVASAVGGLALAIKSVQAGMAVVGAINAFNAALAGTALATGASTLATTVYNTTQKILSFGTKVATAAQWLFNAALTANPIGIVVMAIAALVAGLIWFFTKTETGRKAWQKITAVFKSTITNIKKWFNDFKVKAGEVVTSVVNFFKTLPARIINSIRSLNSKIINFFKNIPGWIKQGVGNLASIGKDLVAGLWQGFKDKFISLLGKFKGLVNLLPTAVKKVLGIASPSKIFAWIGKMMGLGLEEGGVSSLAIANKHIGSQIDGMIGGFMRTADVGINASLFGSASTENASTNTVLQQILAEITDINATFIERLREILKELGINPNDPAVARLIERRIVRGSNI